MSFLWIPKSIRHRTECSFFYENVELPTNCISDRWCGYRCKLPAATGWLSGQHSLAERAWIQV